LKREALALYLFGLSVNKIEHLTSIKQTTLFKWIRDLGPKFELMRSKQSLKIKPVQTNYEKLIRMVDSDWALVYKDGVAELRVQAKDKIKKLERKKTGVPR
jgi:hypothetical protein